MDESIALLINLLIIGVFTITPAVILLIVIYKMDKNRPEPKGLVLRTFFFGILSIAITLTIGFFIGRIDAIAYEKNPWLGYLVMSFITAALLEESAKLLTFYIIIYRNRFFDEVMDGIVYMVSISLSFAAVENFMYGITTGGDPLTIGLRAFTAVPLHMICSGIMGYYIGQQKINNAKESALKGLLLAIFIHGTYNFCAFASEQNFIFFIGMFVVEIIFLIVLFRLIKKAKDEDFKKGRTMPSPSEVIDELNKL